MKAKELKQLLADVADNAEILIFDEVSSSYRKIQDAFLELEGIFTIGIGKRNNKNYMKIANGLDIDGNTKTKKGRKGRKNGK